MHIEFNSIMAKLAQAKAQKNAPGLIQRDSLGLKDAFRDFFNDNGNTATREGDHKGKISELASSAAEGLRSGQLTKREFDAALQRYQLEVEEYEKFAMTDGRISEAEKAELDRKTQAIADELTAQKSDDETETPTVSNLFIADQLDKAKNSLLREKDVLTHMGDTFKAVGSGIDEGSFSIAEIETALIGLGKFVRGYGELAKDGLSEQEKDLAEGHLDNGDTWIAASRVDNDGWEL